MSLVADWRICPKCKRKMKYKLIYNSQTKYWNDYYVCTRCWFKILKKDLIIATGSESVIKEEKYGKR